jgi:hypothetical protein
MRKNQDIRATLDYLMQDNADRPKPTRYAARNGLPPEKIIIVKNQKKFLERNREMLISVFILGLCVAALVTGMFGGMCFYEGMK